MRTIRRLVFVSSVTPRKQFAGELLLYRHLNALSSWECLVVVPEEKPVFCRPNHWVENTVPSIPKWLGRFRQRFCYLGGDSLAARWLVQRFEMVTDKFAPDVILSVMLPDPFCNAAALYAKRRYLPLVLICHDDYRGHSPKGYECWARRVFRQAAVRLCVSEPMAKDFSLRYGVEADVLFPVPSGPAGAVRRQHAADPLVVGFAGTVGIGYESSLLMLAETLRRCGGKLVIASPNFRSLLPRLSAHEAVCDLGLLPPDQVPAALLREGTNVVAVVQSYAASDLAAFKLNFPSKLPEYATLGLPLIVVAPGGSSAAMWARRHPGAALLLERLSEVEFGVAVERLQKPCFREELAHGFHEAAAAFDPDKIHKVFEGALLRACQN